jgi:hypothetical protein
MSALIIMHLLAFIRFLKKKENLICSEHEFYLFFSLFEKKIFFLHEFDVYVCFIEINNSIKADEKVVMTYVSSYYHAFSTTQKVILCMKYKILI